MKIKKGDKVVVLSGDDRGKPAATVLRVLPKTGKVLVEGRNMVTRHRKANTANNTPGGRIEMEAPIAACKVALFSEKLGKPVRVQMRWVGDGGKLFGSLAEAKASFAAPPARIRKVRYSPRSEEVLDK